MTGAGAIAVWGMFLLVPDMSGGLDHLLWVSGGALLILTLHLPLSSAFHRILPVRAEFYHLFTQIRNGRPSFHHPS